MSRRPVWQAAIAVSLLLAVVNCTRQKALLSEYALPGDPERASQGDTQILFGDLHVHSTYSVDAYVMNLPIMSGEGARPLSEACDFARYCSGLDFWATTEHAESLTPQVWRKIRDQMRACDAKSDASGAAQTVVFTGFEWTQLGLTPETEYGHKNVIFKHLDDAHLPPRPIAMGSFPVVGQRSGKFDPAGGLYILALLQLLNPAPYLELSMYIQGLQKMKTCAAGVDSRKLPPDCLEVAPDSATLFEKLNQLGLDALVIPHGTSWGLHVPPLTDWKSQLTPRNHDPNRQRLFEVYSGHGSSEQVMNFNEPVIENGQKVCPMPSKNYLPCCWRAGELAKASCESGDGNSCESKAAEARTKFMAGGLQGFRTVPAAKPEDWLNCGQCTDCFSPAFNYRPYGSVQRALSVSRFDEKGNPERFTFGFIGSSDTHRSSPGSGVNEVRSLADGAYPANSVVRKAMGGGMSTAIDWEFERQSSFWYTGGLAAVHATGKNRDAIWDALYRRETYATSGPRILLWLNLINDTSGAKKPMGAEGLVSEMPRFEVRAAGSFRQKPGCSPDGGLGEERERICRGACYNPTDERIPIMRIEIVKIRPQKTPGESTDGLVQDPWKIIQCDDKGTGCKATFEDPEFQTEGRPSLYYVRAIQAATPGVNTGTLRCEYDAQGRCIKTNPCYGDYRTDENDQCYTPTEERAWSSPIFVQAAAR